MIRDFSCRACITLDFCSVGKRLFTRFCSCERCTEFLDLSENPLLISKYFAGELLT